jgi:peptidoglycan/xylan/chitin deacetylase (PgdA/CDA1 family)
MNIDWWLQETGGRGLQVTWFLVAGGISTSNPAMNGTWERWRQALAAGHALESHTVTHLSAAKNELTWKGIAWEYGDSKAMIEAGLGDGHRVTCLAYPGGGQSAKNDPEIAAAHYAAARGTRGMLNGPQGLDYLSVNAMSKANFGERPENAFNNADNLMNPDYKNGYRGWCVVLYHYIKESDPAAVAGVRADLDYGVKHRDQLWIGTFPDVACYAQERETARLSMAENTPERIAFDLTDRMDDRVFDLALTVKIRLPDTWSSATATQSGKPAKVRLVKHDGATFALVDAVPDKGRTTLVR